MIGSFSRSASYFLSLKTLNSATPAALSAFILSIITPISSSFGKSRFNCFCKYFSNDRNFLYKAIQS